MYSIKYMGIQDRQFSLVLVLVGSTKMQLRNHSLCLTSHLYQRWSCTETHDVWRWNQLSTWLPKLSRSLFFNMFKATSSFPEDSGTTPLQLIFRVLYWKPPGRSPANCYVKLHTFSLCWNEQVLNNNGRWLRAHPQAQLSHVCKLLDLELVQSSIPCSKFLNNSCSYFNIKFIIEI